MAEILDTVHIEESEKNGKGFVEVSIEADLISTVSNLELQHESLLPSKTSQLDLSRYLITSPYTELPHLLDLSTLDTPNQLFSLALQKMQPTTSSYATTPYQNAFNWSAIISELSQLCEYHSYNWKTTSFYCVVFISTVRLSCNYPDLSALDKLSHAEAMACGGFLKYWFGTPNAERKNLATCIWRSKEDARNGSTGVAHRKAAMAASPSYETYGIEGLRLVVKDGAKDWQFENWVG